MNILNYQYSHMFPKIIKQVQGIEHYIPFIMSIRGFNLLISKELHFIEIKQFNNYRNSFIQNKVNSNIIT